jgi:CIC family chloride channel protein
MPSAPYSRGWLLHHVRILVLGAVVGAVAVLFRTTLYATERIRPWLLDVTGGGALALAVSVGFSLAAVLLGVWLVSRVCPESAGSGIPGVKALAIEPHPVRWLRLLLVKFSGGVLSIGGGLALGREGPTIQMGAALGELLGHTGKIPADERRQLLLVGAGAGLAGAFDAPLAGALLVFEELRDDFRAATCFAALVAAFAAGGICQAFLGEAPELGTYAKPVPALGELPWFLLLGVLGGLLGVAFNQGLLGLLRLRERLNRWFFPVLLAVAVGVVGWLHPHWVGGGYPIIAHAQAGGFTLTTALLLLGLRAALTLGGYATGAAGGLFAPMLVMGALLGDAVSHCGAGDREALVIAGMAALFTGIVRAPFTGVVLLVEMAGAQSLVLPLLAASLTAKLTADALGDKPIYDALMEEPARPSGVQDVKDGVTFSREPPASAGPSRSPGARG